MASDRLIRTLKRLALLPTTLYFTWSPVRLGLAETDVMGCNTDKEFYAQRRKIIGRQRLCY
jgi:hypothetical protein